MQEVSFYYRSRNGEVKKRTIIPDALEFLHIPNPEYGHQPGWFLSGWDKDKKGRRSFSLALIILYELPEITPRGRPLEKLWLKD